MVFTVLVAADVYGTKGNFEVTFPAAPSLAELTRQTESIYGVEAAARRPVGTLSAPFLVSRFQLYNERVQQWVDLSAPGQLADRCQVFAFQTTAAPGVGAAEAAAATHAAATEAAVTQQVVANQQAAAAAAHNAAAHTAAANQVAANAAAAATSQAALYAQSQAQLQATAAANHAVATQQTARAVSQVAAINAAASGLPIFSETATHEDKTRAVFEGLDTNGNRVLEPEEVRQAFDLLHVDFSSATINDLIVKGDLDHDGVISLGEWQRFAERFPTLVDSFYFRLKAYWEDVRRQQEIRASKEMLAELKERSQQAQVSWLEAQRDSDAARSRLSAQEVALAQAIDGQRAAEQVCFRAEVGHSFNHSFL